jgi:2-amino-4-hydroxy-6-hydroxymethyldihydropteridine diphosphokinase
MARPRLVQELSHVAYIGLGSNLGDRQIFIAYGMKRLSHLEQSMIGKISGLYSTQPVGIQSNIPFLNMVIQLYTELSPHRLLEYLLQIEKDAGRTENQRKGSRVLDMDILFYDRDILNEGGLILPHPELHTRKFMLQPLADVAYDMVHPMQKKTIQELLNECSDEYWVKRMH